MDVKDGKSKRPRHLNDIRAFSGNSSFTEGSNCAISEVSVVGGAASSGFVQLYSARIECVVVALQDAPICWICLDGARSDAHLLQPCNCPRHAHAHCLARWQLQSAGSRQAVVACPAPRSGALLVLMMLISNSNADCRRGFGQGGQGG
jgi:hypothetical protein